MNKSHSTFSGEDLVITLESPHVDAALVHVTEIVDRAGIDMVPVTRIRLAMENDQAVDRAGLPGSTLTVNVSWQNETHQFWPLVVGYRELEAGDKGRAQIELELMPPYWALAYQGRFRVYADQAVPDIIRDLMTQSGFVEGKDFEFRLSETYPKARDKYYTQFRETDLEFMRRLCENYGISMFMEYGDSAKAVFADSNIHWNFAKEDIDLDYVQTGERRDIYEFCRHASIMPARFMVQDYNWHFPGQFLEHYMDLPKGIGNGLRDHDVDLMSQEEAKLITKVRSESRICGAYRYHGRCAWPLLRYGSVFRLRNHPTLADRKFQVIHLEFHYRQSHGESDTAERPATEVVFEAIDADVQARPCQTRSRPRIDGVFHGIVEPQMDGRQGEVDDYGHYRVRMLMDDADGQAVYPVVRLMQPSLGGNYGFHFPLRANVEVLVSFIDGNPDRPVIVGAVDNGQQPIPIGATAHSQNVIRTGGNNQIHLEDESGKERIKLQTPREDTYLQLGYPNFPESGFALTTAGGVTSSTDTSTSTVSSWANLHDGMFSVSKHGNISTIAKGNKGPLESFKEFFKFWKKPENIKKLADFGKSVLKEYQDIRDRHNEFQLNNKTADYQRAKDDFNKSMAANLPPLPDCLEAARTNPAADWSAMPALKDCLDRREKIRTTLNGVTAPAGDLIDNAAKGGSFDFDPDKDVSAGTSSDFVDPKTAGAWRDTREKYQKADSNLTKSMDKVDGLTATVPNCDSTVPVTGDTFKQLTALRVSNCPNGPKTDTDPACKTYTQCTTDDLSADHVPVTAETLKGLQDKAHRVNDTARSLAKVQAEVWDAKNGPEAVRCKTAEVALGTVSTFFAAWSLINSLLAMFTAKDLSIKQAVQWAFVTRMMQVMEDNHFHDPVRAPAANAVDNAPARHDDKTEKMVMRAEVQDLIINRMVGPAGAMVPRASQATVTHVLGADKGSTVVYGDEAAMVYGQDVIIAGLNSTPKGTPDDDKAQNELLASATTGGIGTAVSGFVAKGAADDANALDSKKLIDKTKVGGRLTLYGHDLVTVTSPNHTRIQGYKSVTVQSPKSISLQTLSRRKVAPDDVWVNDPAPAKVGDDVPSTTLSLDHADGLLAETMTADKTAQIKVTEDQKIILTAGPDNGDTAATLTVDEAGTIEIETEGDNNTILVKNDKAAIKLFADGCIAIDVAKDKGLTINGDVKVKGKLQADALIAEKGSLDKIDSDKVTSAKVDSGSRGAKSTLTVAEKTAL